MNHLKSQTIIFIFIMLTAAANAQDSSLKHDDILKIDVYLVERSKVCLDKTDYPKCKSIAIKELNDILKSKDIDPYSIEIPPKVINYENYLELYFYIRDFKDDYVAKKFELAFDEKLSILLVIQNENLADQKISIIRSECKDVFNEPIGDYASSTDFTLRYKERWFNHQNALFFHPDYKCKFEIKAENQDKSWVLHFIYEE